jgi:pSer/pThr/pTyr-binding forkhead associated (FHA) protein
MARLILQFENKVLKEISIADRALSIGRSPDNDLAIDNLAVSNHHARIFPDAGEYLIEDLSSMNGTFINGRRVERATLHNGDVIQIGKHEIRMDLTAGAATPMGAGPKAPAPNVAETMMLDTRERRAMIEEAVTAGERSQPAPTRVLMPTLIVMHGKTDRGEYLLTGKLTVIGKSPMATVQLKGWFAPQAGAQITRREDGYYLGRGERIPKINGMPIDSPTKLKDGDVIEVGRVRLQFLFRD